MLSSPCDTVIKVVFFGILMEIFDVTANAHSRDEETVDKAVQGKDGPLQKSTKDVDRLPGRRL
ncbi:hypothetical protein DICSQDRAFT_166140 [Dichomitus squalens LYAD-421 SS1]|uniref:uncharacterized protein n=1 Tax=Dichomitus squalens (strain LYAD-421) TaxID=732165 RepID=UPI0004415313|nr:uncharacterized protein DICSQDRAFT_166140 [Dichomitus squalens LYAD-421 SS1]EJF65088.1 hypothetical protein DICSQDRAFT_166140 [Dichomitus squalens LYAD-421 SS1]